MASSLGKAAAVGRERKAARQRRSVQGPACEEAPLPGTPNAAFRIQRRKKRNRPKCRTRKERGFHSSLERKEGPPFARTLKRGRRDVCQKQSRRKKLRLSFLCRLHRSQSRAVWRSEQFCSAGAAGDSFSPKERGSPRRGEQTSASSRFECCLRSTRRVLDSAAVLP